MKKAALHNLGCKVNAYETEAMQHLLEEAGYEIVPFTQKADVYVINTCSVTNMADRKSRQMLHKAKKNNPDSIVVAAGCYVQTSEKEVLNDLSVDIVIGNDRKHDLVRLLEEYSLDSVNDTVDDINDGKHDFEELFIDQTKEHTRAFIKVQDGCNQFCSYCIIPKIRGHFRSVPMEELLNEAKRLASEGVKELVLVAQETTLYGKDLTGEKQLPLLLHELCKIEGIEWIRLLYCYPEEITDELIEAIKTEEKVCNYIDMPIQHSENRILQRMGRRTSREDLVAVIKKLRKEIPDITIRTTLITGFPGESEEDHEGLMNFVEECKFDRLGVFTYSPEEDTLAATFEDQIDEEVKEARRDELMSLQQEISYEHTQQLVGKTIKVMVEGYLFEDDIYVGRSYMDAPKVDGCVFINSPEELMTGDFVYVKITQGREYDVIGEVDYEFTK